MHSKSISRIITLLFLSIFIHTGIFAQADTNSVRPFIISCADSMVKAFSKGDYATMAGFTNDNLVKMIGGKKAYVAILEKTMGEGDMAKAEIQEAGIGKIIKVVKTVNGFQCLVEQRLTIIFEKTKVKSVSALYGYADNTGKRWKFADISNKDAEMVKMIVPDLDKRLIIPKKVETVEKL